MNIIKKHFKGKNKKNQDNEQTNSLTESYEKNIAMLQNIFSNDDTIIFRELNKQLKKDIRICVIFARGMVDSNTINRDIILPILSACFNKNTDKNIIDIISKEIIVSANLSRISDVDRIIGSILTGESVVLIENSCEAMAICTQGFKTRSIQEPISEKSIRGPRQGFSEEMIVNTSLIRRRINNSDLKFEFSVMGKQTKTKICICYMDNLVNKKILEELYKRLNDIDIDAILDSGYIQEYIQDSRLSSFKTIGNSEKPDKVSANILEGRIAVIVDGTPSVLTLPFLFVEYFQSSEDYYNNYWYGSFNRFLRYFSFFLSTSVAALYIAVTTFHQEIIPSPLLLSISASREGLPFPSIVEAVVMIFTFEILREVGVRMPSPMGSTLGFVGAIILGQAAVSARFISAPMVIIVGLTGISSYLLPAMIMSLNIVRILLLLLTAFLGGYGYVLGVIAVSLYLMTLRSFGVPYMLHIGSLKLQDIKDTTMRLPRWYMNYRPKIIGRKNPVREKGRT